MSVDKCQTASFAQDADHLCGAIRFNTVTRNHRYSNVFGQCHAGGRIDQVGIADAVDIEVLFHIAGSGDGRIGQQKNFRKRRIRCIE